MPVRTKIEISPAIVRRISGLDDLARIFFPDNRNHQRAFVALWVTIKYSDGQFLPSTSRPGAAHHLTQRTVEIARAKMKKLGLIERISHFNPRHGYRSGWTFSSRAGATLRSLAQSVQDARRLNDGVDGKKDRNSINYL